MKTVTMSVVDAMNDVHQVQMEADTAMYAIWHEYFTVLALIFGSAYLPRSDERRLSDSRHDTAWTGPACAFAGFSGVLANKGGAA